MFVFILGGIPELLLKIQMLLVAIMCIHSVPAKKDVELVTVMRFWNSVVPQSYGVTNGSHRHLVK